MNKEFEAYKNMFTPEERKMLVAMSIKANREKNGLSQKEVADALGINAQTYSSYERGRSEAPYEILVRLSLYYGIPLDILLQRDNFGKDRLAIIEQLKQVTDGMQDMKEKLVSDDTKDTKNIEELTKAFAGLSDILSQLKDKI